MSLDFSQQYDAPIVTTSLTPPQSMTARFASSSATVPFK